MTLRAACKRLADAAPFPEFDRSACGAWLLVRMTPDGQVSWAHADDTVDGDVLATLRALLVLD